jgi:hypothetical protein
VTAETRRQLSGLARASRRDLSNQPARAGAATRVAMASAERTLEQPVEGEEQHQGDQHQHDAGEAVQEAPPGLVAEVVGDQHQHDHAHEVGRERDRQDAGEHDRVVQLAAARHDVHEERPERRQAVHRMQPEQASATSIWYWPIIRVTPSRLIE